MNVLKSFIFIAFIASGALSFLNIFSNYSLSVAMTTNQIVVFGQKLYV